MNNMSVRKSYIKINHSILFYIPYVLIFIKYSCKKYDVLELCFYFVFIYDRNYNEFISNLSMKSNFTKSLREYHYFRMQNKYESVK